MKKTLFNKILALSILTLNFSLQAESLLVQVHSVTPERVGETIGTIEFKQLQQGLEIIPNLHSLPEGERAIHIHENPSCEPGVKDGKPTAALAAGPHYDPHHTGKHMGPEGEGHLGDLPTIQVDNQGKAIHRVFAKRLVLNEIKKRSIIIHEGGDNYSDSPKPLGGAGARIACGIIP